MNKLMKRGALFATSLFAMTLVGCGSSDKPVEELFDAIPVIVEKGENWGFLDRDGNVLYQDEFESAPSAIFDGVFTVREGSNYVLYKAGGKKPEVIKGCDELVAAGVMVDGLMPVTKPMGRISLINKSGETKFELEPCDDHEIVESDIAYRDGMLKVRNDENLYGFVNRSGEMVIKPAYKAAGPFSEDRAIVIKDEEENRIVIDKKGETVFKLKDGWTLQSEFFYKGAIIVRDDNDRILIIDKNGESFKCSSKVRAIASYNDKYIVFRDENRQYGVMKRGEEGETVIRAKYNSITLMPDNKFLCIDDDNEAIILDSDGEKTLTIDDYKYGVKYIEPFGLVGRDKNLYVFLQDDGKPRKNAEYYEFGNLFLGESVKSDYVDLNLVEKLVKDVVASEGVSNFKYSSSPQKILSGQPSDYNYTSLIPVEDLTGQGSKVSYTTNAFFKKSIATYDYGDYVWTPDNSLMGFELKAFIYSDLDNEYFDKLKSIVEETGYKCDASKYEDNTGLAIFRKGNLTVMLDIYRRYGSESILTVSVTRDVDNDYYRHMVESIKGNGAVALEPDAYTEAVEENTEAVEVPAEAAE